MPLFSSKLDLTTAAKNAGTELADVTYIKGAFKVYADLDTVYSESISRVANDQIVFVSDNQTLYQATITEPDYVNTFVPSASWSEFDAFAGDIKGVTAGDGLAGGGTVGTVELTLDTGSAHFTEALQAINYAGIFKQTGSVYSTTNDLEVSGSFTLDYDGSTDPFKVTSGSLETFSVSGEGILTLISQSGTPTAKAGGIYFGSDGNFYFGS